MYTNTQLGGVDMKGLLILLVGGWVSFGIGYFDNTRPYKDAWGNSYKYYENLWRDTDKDGITNYFDYNDRNPYIQNKYQKDFFRMNNKRWDRW